MSSLEEEYQEFVACLMTTYVEEDPENGSRSDLRNRKAKAYLAERAFLWLEPHNFAAAYSSGLAVHPDRRVVAEEIAGLEEEEELAARLFALAAAGELPLVAKLGHPAESTLSVLLESGQVGHDIYRRTTALLIAAFDDSDVNPFIWRPQTSSLSNKE